jgi:Mrp family chromosome partitioning ATPase
MALLAEELHSRYSDRIVIFDSPPLLATTQAEVLAALVGQVVLVVEAEKTLQSMVSDSMNKLKVCDVVLAILNKSTYTVGLNYYNYGQYGH